MGAGQTRVAHEHALEACDSRDSQGRDSYYGFCPCGWRSGYLPTLNDVLAAYGTHVSEASREPEETE